MFLSACDNVIENSSVASTSPSEILSSNLNDDLDNNTSNIELSTEYRYLNAINKARESSQDCGIYGIMPAVKPLTWNKSLEDAASEHSNDMAQTEFFSHAGSGTQYDLTSIAYDLDMGSSSEERAEYNGYNTLYTGENIAAGYDTVDLVVASWLLSDGHCKNIMNDTYEDMGMALVEKLDTEYITYWTLDFGKK